MENKKQSDRIFTKLPVKRKAIIKKAKLTVESIFSSISGVFFCRIILLNYLHKRYCVKNTEQCPIRCMLDMTKVKDKTKRKS